MSRHFVWVVPSAPSYVSYQSYPRTCRMGTVRSVPALTQEPDTDPMPSFNRSWVRGCVWGRKAPAQLGEMGIQAVLTRVAPLSAQPWPRW